MSVCVYIILISELKDEFRSRNGNVGAKSANVNFLMTLSVWDKRYQCHWRLALTKLSLKLDLWLKFGKDNCYGGMPVSGRLLGPVNVNVPMSKLMGNEAESDSIIMSKVGDKWNRVTNQISTTAVSSASTLLATPVGPPARTTCKQTKINLQPKW